MDGRNGRNGRIVERGRALMTMGSTNPVAANTSSAADEQGVVRWHGRPVNPQTRPAAFGPARRRVGGPPGRLAGPGQLPSAPEPTPAEPQQQQRQFPALGAQLPVAG
ncbi:hypothetical protein GCM10012275_32560 [Longimycelium tulufanense]|uniref:Uncharacterized protein n=1 Tax=Longimycelium tulufanense TaxID=907463 RepID=A0A8J3CDM7_9PSEU|nr:hypothetical protein GCM10012275_32560 [Longimycelium tulufanense]